MSGLSSLFADAAGDFVYVIAEAGVNHDGSVNDAHALVDLAAEAGADAVKFQTFQPDALVSAAAPTAAYQRASTGQQSQYTMLTDLVLPDSAWPELRDHADSCGIDFLSTPFDAASLDLLCALGVSAVKVGSGELTNKPLLTDVASRGLPVLCSTGMGTLDEVAAAVGWLVDAPAVALLHCVSSYPAPSDQANLRAISTMRARFGLPVGWSDHTVDVVTAIAAVAIGARVLEKHVTLDTARSGPDHAASADPAAFTTYVAQVRAAAAALGSGRKKPVPAELDTIPLARRSWHTTRDLARGTLLAAPDVTLLRPAVGLSPDVDPIGRTLSVDLAKGQPVLADQLDPAG